MRGAMVFWIALCCGLQCSAADVYPSKPVRVVVPFAPGGTVDFTARIISQQLAEQLGRPFVVDNRTGATGTIANGIVARSSPDGYTIMMADPSLSIVPSLFKSLPFDVVRDFTPITEIIGAPMVLVVNAGTKANTLKEFIALAQANPGKLNFGSGGAGSSTHLPSELFAAAAKVNIVHVPYKGAGEALAALLGGQVQMLIATMPTALTQVKAGKLRALAVTTDGKRSLAMPDVPSMSEAGVQGMGVYLWFGFVGPAGMPKEVVDKLRAEVVKALANADVKERFLAQGAEPVGSSPEDFSRLIKSEIKRWSAVVKSAGIAPE